MKKLLDPEILESLMSVTSPSGLSVWQEISQIFISDTPKHLEKLITAHQSGDHRETGRIAHFLKSSCANVGAISVAEVLNELEMLCQAPCRFEDRDKFVLQIAEGVLQINKQINALNTGPKPGGGM